MLCSFKIIVQTQENSISVKSCKATTKELRQTDGHVTLHNNAAHPRDHHTHFRIDNEPKGSASITTHGDSVRCGMYKGEREPACLTLEVLFR